MNAQFDHLATYSDSSRPSVTRMVFSDWDVGARKYIRKLMEEAGLTVREDVMGNTFGRWQGSDDSAGVRPGSMRVSTLPAFISRTGLSHVRLLAGRVMSGSHSDTVVMGGPYDGALGTLGAIAAIHSLRAAGFKPAKSLEAVMFTTEEASRFSIPCLGR